MKKQLFRALATVLAVPGGLIALATLIAVMLAALLIVAIPAFVEAAWWWVRNFNRDVQATQQWPNPRPLGPEVRVEGPRFWSRGSDLKN